MGIAPALISAGGALIGGFFGHRAQARTNAQNMYIARNQVRMRVADARAAGIHPLAALGMNPVGPVASSSNVLGDAVAQGAASVADGMIGRRDAQRQAVADRQAAERFELENQLLRSQIAQTNAGTAAMLGAATSRTAISAARAAAIGGAAPSSSDPASGSMQTVVGSIPSAEAMGYATGDDLTSQFGEAGDLIAGAHLADAASRSAMGMPLAQLVNRAYWGLPRGVAALARVTRDWRRAGGYRGPGRHMGQEGSGGAWAGWERSSDR